MTQPHVPVLLNEVLAALEPRDGEVFIDGTYGAGGYSRAILADAATAVLGVDRDPNAIRNGGRQEGLKLVLGEFAHLDEIAASSGLERADGVVLDIGVSSMQLDDAGRGFSFQKDGPLDMRMSNAGPSAADVVNEASEMALADILFHYGEEKRARAIARAIASSRARTRLTRTSQLTEIVESVLGRARPGLAHPATRTFQAIRIFVNDELTQLAHGLAAAERILKPGGRLAIVTFHSLEDRVVKRFLSERCGRVAHASRHVPEQRTLSQPSFELIGEHVIEPSPREVERNPRARSAKLRAARRTQAPAYPFAMSRLGLPAVAKERI